ncbi:MAG: ABC transporter ATP-binding protein, partial [Mesorhizobium sp.]
GDTDQILNAPRHAYTRTLLDAHLGLDARPLLDRQGAPA